MQHKPLSFISTLQKSSLFHGLTLSEIENLIADYQPATKLFRRGEVVLLAGTSLNEIGILLSGQLSAEKNTLSGGRMTFTVLFASDIFGDILAGSHSQSPVTLTAVQDSSILYLSHEKILQPQGKLLTSHTKVLRNLVAAISDKYFIQNRRLDILSVGSLQEKIATYLSDVFSATTQDSVNIPLNREQLATYLHCDRSALSRALSVMKKRGAIDYYKNSFKLLNKQKLLQFE